MHRGFLNGILYSFTLRLSFLLQNLHYHLLKIPRRCRGIQTVKKTLWVVWRAATLQMQSESGDMCGGFGSLAVQGFLALFPAREPRGGERETA